MAIIHSHAIIKTNYPCHEDLLGLLQAQGNVPKLDPRAVILRAIPPVPSDEGIIDSFPNEGISSSLAPMVSCSEYQESFDLISFAACFFVAINTHSEQ